MDEAVNASSGTNRDDKEPPSDSSLKLTISEPDSTSPRQIRDGSDAAESVASRKRKLTLELPQLIVQDLPSSKGVPPGSPSKSSRLSPSSAGGNAVLSSPDVRMLKISSPELERLIRQSWMAGNKTPTPTSVSGKDLTEEQQLYAKGFVDALAAVQTQQAVAASVSPFNMGFTGMPLTIPVDLSQGGNLPVGFPVTQPIQFVSIPQGQNGQSQGQPGLIQAQYFLNSRNGGPMSPIMVNPVLLSQLQSTNAQFKPMPLPNPPPPTAPKPRVSVTTPTGTRREKVPAVMSNEHADSYSPSTSLSPVTSEGQRVPSRASSVSITGTDKDESNDPLSYLNDSDEEDETRKARKRERNRLAAARCRQRKLNKIEELEERVRELKDQNDDLVVATDSMRKASNALKKEVARHVQAGCKLALPEHLARSVEKFLPRSTMVQTDK